uniref:PH domain-containing protein n=1 Tax=Angiostrongylus cantonensis TaxID=6313 RepID=A0A0K0D532_ANGCA
LHCFTNSDILQCPSAEQTLLLVPITSTSRIIVTSHPNTLLLSSDSAVTIEGYGFYITTESYKTMVAWKKAIEMQIDDCAIWGEFAYRPTKLTFEKPVDPIKQTLSRATGNRLYDKISIAGSLSRNNGVLSTTLCYGPIGHSSLMTAQTAPMNRHKNRANVLELFEKPKQSHLDVRSQTSSCSPTSDEVHKCIIEVDNDNGYGRIHSGSSLSNRSVAVNEPSVYGYSSASTLRYKNIARNNVMSNDTSSGESGAKSWSRSLGAFLGKKIQTYPVEVTRL